MGDIHYVKIFRKIELFSSALIRVRHYDRKSDELEGNFWPKFLASPPSIVGVRISTVGSVVFCRTLQLQYGMSVSLSARRLSSVTQLYCNKKDRS